MGWGMGRGKDKFATGMGTGQGHLESRWDCLTSDRWSSLLGEKFPRREAGGSFSQEQDLVIARRQTVPAQATLI